MPRHTRRRSTACTRPPVAPIPRREPRHPTSFGDRIQSPLQNGRAVCASLWRPRPPHAESNARLRCEHRSHAVPSVSRSRHRLRTSPGVATGARPFASEIDLPRWPDCLDLEARTPATPAQHPIGWIHHRCRRFPANTGGLSAEAPYGAFDSQPRTPDSAGFGRTPLRDVAASESILADPASRRPEHLETHRNHVRSHIVMMQTARDLHRRDPKRSPWRPLPRHGTRWICQKPRRAHGATSMSPRSQRPSALTVRHRRPDADRNRFGRAEARPTRPPTPPSDPGETPKPTDTRQLASWTRPIAHQEIRPGDVATTVPAELT